MSFASFKCAMEQRKSQFRDGFTLIELVAVVAILSIIAVFAVTKISSVAEKAKISAAERDLATLREAFMSEESGYLRDMGNVPGFSLGYLRIANLMMPTNLFGVVESDATLKVGFRVDDPNRVQNPDGCAPHEAFTKWNADAGRGWRGPYINTWTGDFPTESARRFSEDASFEERGFFPPLDNLRLPEVFTRREGGCSVYGFPGEPAVIDPWGNPYVLQIPPAQAFEGVNTNLSDEIRFRYARVVSAGPDGRLSTPCFALNKTNHWDTTWSESFRRLSRQAGRDDRGVAARGDDIILFLVRNDIDEGEEEK